MQGIADGVTQQSTAKEDAVDVLDILALNVRSEVLFGLFTFAGGTKEEEEGEENGISQGLDEMTVENNDIPMDGCTSLGFVRGEGQTIIAQNWDWMLGSRDNLIMLHISGQGSSSVAENGGGSTQYPDIVMVTEAGIIGKIGFNSAGVGVCQNAIRARGVDVSGNKLPVHLAMRRVLECRSRKEAVEELKTCGVSGSVYLLIGGGGGDEDVVRVSGVECTSVGVEEMFMSTGPPSSVGVEAKENKLAQDGNIEMLVHANRLLLEHPGVEEPPWLVDSDARTVRLREVVNELHGGKGISCKDLKPFEYQLRELFRDEQGYPVSINRRQIEGQSTTETLFTIVMNLTERSALISFGRPTEWKDVMEVSFSGKDGKLQTQRNVRREES